MHVIMMDFMIWGRLTRPRGPFGALGTALTRNVEDASHVSVCTSEDGCVSVRRFALLCITAPDRCDVFFLKPFTSNFCKTCYKFVLHFAVSCMLGYLVCPLG